MRSKHLRLFFGLAAVMRPCPWSGESTAAPVFNVDPKVNRGDMCGLIVMIKPRVSLSTKIRVSIRKYSGVPIKVLITISRAPVLTVAWLL